MPASLESLFTRWRTTGQPEALGELFDRTSPQLLAVALHLCPHPADAEDALQATFVAAIDAAARWDASRPVLPWLTGILTKQGRRIGERRARRRERELPDEPVVLEDGSPVAASERRELIGVLREHIDRLPAEQRQVLLLQLEHGLAPAEVAEVLGVAPGTVRMRLHRGVHALRSVLPASLAALLVAALPSRGVAAVRTAVLGHGAAAAALVGGGVLTKKLAIAAAIVLACAGAWTLAAPWWDGAPPVATAPVVPATAALVAADAPRDESHGEDPARVEAPRPAARDAAGDPAAATGSLLVRAISASTGAPVPHLPVSVYRPDSDLGDRYERDNVCTGRDGTVLLRDRAPGRVRATAAAGSGRGETRIVAATTTTLELRVPAEALAPRLVRGRVRHADGAPAPGATVVVGPQYEGYAEPIGAADAAGGFAFELPGPIVVIGARLAGRAPSLLQFLPANGEPVELVLPGPSAIAAVRVLDPSGSPVAGAHVEVGAKRRGSWEENGRVYTGQPPQRGRCDADGRWTVDELPEGDVEVFAAADGFAPLHRFATLRMGERTDVVCELAPGTSLRGRVVDQRGEPVAGVRLRLGGGVIEGRTTDAEGRFAFRHATAGRQQLQLSGTDVLNRSVEREAGAAGEWVIEVERGARFLLRFVDDMERPLAAWSVRLQSAAEREETTDAAGRVALQAFGAGPYSLWLGAPDSVHPVVSCAWPDAVPGVERTIVVPVAMQPSGSLSGTAVTADGAPLAGGWFTVRAADGRFLARDRFAGPRFEVRRVPSGDWVLSVHRDETGCPLARFRVDALRHGEARDLGELRLPREGAVRVSAVRADGGDAKDTMVFLQDDDGHETVLPPDGAAHAHPAGRYTWCAMHEQSLWQRGTLEVRAGETAPLDVLLQPGVRRYVRFPVPCPQWGSPRRIDWVLRAPDGSVYQDGDFDPAEHMPWAFMPTLARGTWRVELVLDDGRRFAGSIAIDSMAPSRTPIDVAVEPSR